MTPHGPAIIGGGGRQIVCKYCSEEMDEPFDMARATDATMRRHAGDCPRRQEYDRKKLTERRERERAEADRLERERRLDRARRSWTSRRDYLRTSTSMMMSSRGHATAAPPHPEQAACSRIATQLINTNPYSGLTFETLLTPTPTGQAIVMKGSYKREDVAVKIYLRNNTVEFQDEVRMLRQVGTHKNVTSMITSFDSPRQAVVLPFADKGSLRQALEERALPNAMVVQYAKQIAEGLCHIHSQGVAHLDIKADNILIDRANVAQITDFGLSSLFTGYDTITPGMGTMMFIAPEGLFDSGSKSDASKMDTYAFGMVMYEMLSGKLPYEEFYRGDEDEFNACIAQKVEAGDTPALDRRWASATVQVMQACWIKHPDRRPSMADVKKSLARL